MHDPARHTEYVRQALRQDKSPIGFFIGAGCPVSIRVPREDGGDPQPLIPDIAGMTARVRAELEASEHAEEFGKLIATFDGADPNLEEMLSAVRALAAVVGSGTVHGLDSDALTNLERAISASVVTLASVELPSAENGYRTLAAWTGAVARVKPIEGVHDELRPSA